LPLLLYVCLLTLFCLSASAQEFDFSISPTSLNLNDVENFVTLHGVSAGTESTIVRYSLGETSVSLQPQGGDPDPNNPRGAPSLIAWIPVVVAITEGRWSITVIATDSDQSVRTYGPAFLDVIPAATGGEGETLPEVVIGEAETAAGGHVTFDVGTASCDRASGEFFAMGPTTVHCGSGSFSVIVTDTVKPEISVPADFASASNTPTFTVTATDNIDGAVPADHISCSPASGDTFPDGVTEVQCGAQDNHANYTFGTFKITVGLPILHLPDNITAEATSAAGAVVTYDATADGGTVSCTPASGSTFALGTTTVNCSATNINGTTTGSFTVTVRDTTPPVISDIDASPRDILWPPNHKLIPITMIVTASDTVDPHPHAQIVSVTSDQPIDCGCGDGDTAPDWVITGDLTLQVRAERTGGVNRNYTVTIAVTDASGNTTTGTFVISVHI
jgi:hypothetical protein